MSTQWQDLEHIYPNDGHSAHGTWLGYAWRYCRCPDCTEAQRLYQRQKMDNRLPHLAPEHGKYTTYSNWGCRCTPCTEANTIKCKEYRKQKGA